MVGLSALITVILLVPAVAVAQPQMPQTLTIPQALARGWTGWTVTSPSGQAPTIADVVEESDVIARGVLGSPRSYLSEDQREVFADYPLSNVVVIYQSVRSSSLMTSSSRPGEVIPFTVTQVGGTITIGNVSFAHRMEGLPPLRAGSEGLFLLKIIGDKHRIVGNYFGAFAIDNGSLTPLTSRKDFAPEYRGVRVEEAIADVEARARSLHP